MQCDHTNVTSNYAPPPIGNGELSIQLDMQGIQRQRDYHHMTPGIYWAGRRLDTRDGRLISYGFIEQDTDEPTSWQQRLDAKAASIHCDCTYADGQQITTDAFVHIDHPLLVMRKSAVKPRAFRYNLAKPGSPELLPERVTCSIKQQKHGAEIQYQVAGLPELDGIISIWCDDDDCQIKLTHNHVCIMPKSPTVTYCIAFVDGLESQDRASRVDELKTLSQQQGYDGLFASHQKVWDAYWQESFVALPDAKQQEVYETAQYHLRISSTRWALPVGIFPSHWQGKYFSFDDSFAFMGLLTSGHMQMARKIPMFRHGLLQKAIVRAHRYFGNSISGARFSWQQVEDGSESASAGFYLEHMFHLANIALSAWNYYRYSGDETFLREYGYDLIANCAKFYQVQSLYKLDDDRYIVGKYTDLERLGPARENAYMTTCGVIATFDAAVKAAALLDVNDDDVAQWKFYAAKLRQSLPVDDRDSMYIPHPDCEQKSIAMLAGTYPYPAMFKDDPKQRRAIDDFIENEAAFGNMYPVGNSVCTWYAGWKGVVFARLGDMEKTRQCIAQAAGEANCFSEIFEISDPPMHPWFATAEGVYIHMINESLLQSDETQIRVVATDMQDGRFKLAAVGGMMLEATFKDSQLDELICHAKNDCQRQLMLPDDSAVSIALQAGQSLCVMREGRLVN